MTSTSVRAFTVSAPTTTFAPASFCNTPLLFSSGSIIRGLTCGSDGEASFAEACFPQGTSFVAGLRASVSSPDVEVFFTGSVPCPQGYSTAQSTISAKQTLLACCPSGFTLTTSKDQYYTSDRYWCHSVLAPGQQITQRYCQGGNTGGAETASTTVVVDSASVTEDWSSLSSVFITASPGDWGLEMFPDKNLAVPIRIIVNPTTEAESTTGTTGGLQTSSTGQSTSHSSHHGTGLSPQAQITIGVVVPAVVIIVGIAITVIFCVRKRRKAYRQAWNQGAQPVNHPPPPVQQPGWEKPELASGDNNRMGPPNTHVDTTPHIILYESGGQPVRPQELPVSERPVEAGTQRF